MNKLLMYFNSRTERERGILLLALVLGVPILVWLLLWQPLLSARTQAAEKLVQRDKTYSWMQESSAKIVAAGMAGKQQDSGAGQPLPGQIAQIAKQLSITLTRLEPQSDGRYSIWLASLDYNNAVRFIDTLLKAGITIDNLDLSLLERPGMVSLRAAVRRSS